MTDIEKIRSKIFRRGRYLAGDISHKLGFNEDLYRSARGSRIMIYHGICEQNHTKFNTIFLTVKTFEEHLKFYKKYFNVISLDDHYRQKFSDERFNVCLTFDDGFANNHKYVLPLLEQYKIPATFFVTAIRAANYNFLWNDFLGIISKYGPDKIIYKDEQYYKGQFDKYISTESGIRLVDKIRACGFEEKEEMIRSLYHLAPFKSNKADEDYWLQMTKEQIRQLSASEYVSIGAHGHYHNDLALININDAYNELVFCKQYLEKMIQKPVNSFAFPYGAYTPEVVDAAKKAGYTQLLAMDFHFPEDQNDPAMRERFTVNPFISTNNQAYATITRRYE